MGPMAGGPDMTEVMRFALFLVFLWAIAEFLADLQGRPTIIGCYIRGIDVAYDDGRCAAPEDQT